MQKQQKRGKKEKKKETEREEEEKEEEEMEMQTQADLGRAVTWVVRRPGSHNDLGRIATATWVTRPRSRSQRNPGRVGRHETQVAAQPRPFSLQPMFLFLGFFYLFISLSSLMNIYF